jgi:hypothetical protein
MVELSIIILGTENEEPSDEQVLALSAVLGIDLSRLLNGLKNW